MGPDRLSAAQARTCSALSRSLIFKKMQIVRGCDAKRNALVYMVYTDKLIEGSLKNSTLDGAGDALGCRAAAALRRLNGRTAHNDDPPIPRNADGPGYEGRPHGSSSASRTSHRAFVEKQKIFFTAWRPTARG